jgi:folate-binding protein YgfZ
MSVVTLHDKLISIGAQLHSYRGAETPASFGDPPSEFRALLNRVGVFDMSWQAKLRISGKDRTRWANGLFSNNIRDLASGHGVYCFLLNPQGRNQGDAVVYNRGEELLATTDREQFETLTAWLKRYIIMDKVELEDVSGNLVSIGIGGPQAIETWLRIGIDVAALEPGQLVETVWKDIVISVARNVHPEWNGYEIWIAPEHAARLWETLTSAGAEPVGSEALEAYRIARGVPRYGVDLRERDLPQETGQEHALNFSKGCYIGQEIVERIRSRGNVHRTLIGFEVEGDAPTPGAKVMAADKEAGEITSAARAPFGDGQRTLALGYLRREFAAPGTEVRVGEQSASVQSLPFQKIEGTRD